MKLKLFLASLFILLALVGYKSYRDTQSLKSIDSYESCASSRGSLIQESYPATCVTRLGSHFIQPTPTATPQAEETIQSIPDIRKLFGTVPLNWNGASISGNYLWEDLVQVCVDIQTNGSMDECDYFEYWTNNRTNKWQLLGRYSAGQEGPSSCENWEKWKVAKGMECNRLKDGSLSQVTF